MTILSTGVATSFIDFTRASNATVTDSDGKVKWAPHNLLTNSESFDAASWLKTNAGSTTPTVTANAAVAPNGTTTAETVALGAIDAAGDTSVLYQTFTAVDATYRGGVYVKAATGGDVGKKVWMFMYDSAYRGVASVTLTTEWQLLSATATLTGGVNREFYIATIGSTNGGENQGAVSVNLWGAHLYRSDLGGMKANTSAYPMYNPTTPKNLLGFTEDFSNAAWGSFGISAFGSGSVLNATIAPNGLQTADKIVATAVSGGKSVYQSVTLTSARSVISFYAKAAEYTLIRVADGSAIRYYVSFDLVTGSVVAGSSGGSKYVSASITSVGNGWYRCSVIVENVSASSAIGIVGYPAGATLDGYGAQYTGDGVSGIYLWGAQLSDSASLDTYVPNNGPAPTAAAYYGPRLDYDPVTLAAKGLLVEESRANLMTYSDNFGSTGFPTATNVVVVENDTATTSPDGTTNADKLTDNATNDQHRLFDNYTFTAANAHTLSVYVKRDTHRWFRMLMSDGTTLFYANFDLLSGVVGSKSASVTSSNIIPLSNGWFRVSMTFTVVAALGNVQMVMLNSDSTSSAVSYVGTGTSLWLYGLQIEANAPFATSYIPTGAATATRNADVASVSTQAFPYSATEGTIVVNATSALLPSAYTNGRAAALNDGTANNVIELYISQNAAVAVNAVGRVMLSGVPQTNPSKTITNSANPHKVAFAYKASDFAVTGDGLAPTTETSGSVPTGITQMQLGALTTSNYLNGHIRQITYLPRRLSSTELQTRTA